MDARNLNKLKRSELLEIMLTQSREIELLKKKLKKAGSMIEDKRIHIEKAGSIADAALELNRVFESAQEAADQYLLNIEQLQEQLKEKETALNRAGILMEDFLYTPQKEQPDIEKAYQNEIAQIREHLEEWKTKTGEASGTGEDHADSPENNLTDYSRPEEKPQDGGEKPEEESGEDNEQESEE